MTYSYANSTSYVASSSYHNYSNLWSGYANYANGGATIYGASCGMSYTNYFNAYTTPPTAFTPVIDASVFNSGNKINQSSETQIKNLREALRRIGTEKVNSAGVGFTYDIDGKLAPVADPTLINGQKINASQGQALVQATKDLWSIIKGGTIPAPTPVDITSGKKILGTDISNLIAPITTMAQCGNTYSNCANTYLTGGTNGYSNWYSYYGNGSYFGDSYSDGPNSSGWTTQYGAIYGSGNANRNGTADGTAGTNGN